MLFERINVPDGINVPDDIILKESIWKTAIYIKTKGISFQETLPGDKFPFIKSDNLYYDYYKYLVSLDIDNAIQMDTSISDTDQQIDISSFNDYAYQEPYPFIFSNYDEKISAKDLEIIKITALFCVINEKYEYLSQLKKQYNDELQFGFLKPSHPLNSVFIKFIHQYKQIVLNEFGSRFYLGPDYMNTILIRCFQRAQYREFAKELNLKENEKLENMKIQFAAYEWDKFHLVHTFIIDDNDFKKDLPPPMNITHFSKSIINKEVINLFGDETVAKTLDTKIKRRRNMNIKPIGETRLKRSATHPDKITKHVRCPITHKMIPEEQFDKHLQILLTDPYYKEEKEKYEAKHKLTNLTVQDVHENIKKLVKTGNNLQKNRSNN